MTPPYKKGLKVSLAAHGSFLLLLFVSGFINGCSIFKSESEPIPDIEFTVEIPEDMVADAAENDKSAEEDVTPPEPGSSKEEEDIPAPPEPVVEEKKEPPPEPPKQKENKKVPVVKSTKMVEKKPAGKKREIIPNPPKNVKTVKTPKGPALTAAEIQKLLDMGATPGETTSVPGENERCLLTIKKELYGRWIQPSLANKTVRPATIEISLGASGAVLGRKLISSSGNKELDDSAMSAAIAVPLFKNLTPGFLKQYKAVTIEFEVK